MALFGRMKKQAQQADPSAAPTVRSADKTAAAREDELAAARRDLMLAALESLSEEEEPKQNNRPPIPARPQKEPLPDPANLAEPAEPAPQDPLPEEPDEDATHDWRAAQVVMWDIVQQDIKRLRKPGGNGHPNNPQEPQPE